MSRSVKTTFLSFCYKQYKQIQNLGGDDTELFSQLRIGEGRTYPQLWDGWEKSKDQEAQEE